MRRGEVLTRIVVGLSIAATGCIFDPFRAQVRRVESRVTLLDQRVSQLETDAGITPAALPGPAAFPVGASGAVLPSVSSESSESAGLPGTQSIQSSEQLGKPQLPSVPINWRKAFGKLWRGVVNVLTGWVEIPKRVDETTKRSGPGSGATLGVLRGVGHGFVRTLAGAYETVTFVFPAPPDYVPVIRPEYVFTCLCEEGGWSSTTAPSP